LPHVLAVFEVGGQVAAIPIQNVDRITPMARLARPPGLPAVLEGILNLAGTAVPVLRLDRLFQLGEQRPGLYSTLIVMQGVADGRIALLVDRVSQIVTVAHSEVLPVGKHNSFNECACGMATVGEQVIHLLAPARILLATERKTLSEFQEMAQRRLKEWSIEKE
jgi:purine-binding chemotaxis protein CheW